MGKRWSAMALSTLVGVSTGCVSIGSGQRGVVWSPRGGTNLLTLGEGIHARSPLEEVTLYDLRTQLRNEQLHVLAGNGLSMSLDTTVRFHLVAADVAPLHREIGPTYYDLILGPVLRSQSRRVVGRYLPEDIYSSKRELIEREIREAVQKAIEGKHIELEAILIRNVGLPPTIEAAINSKAQAEQEALKMQFILQRERMEADRKSVEAAGIARYQDIIAAKLPENYLRWKQIEALADLSKSQNAKVIVLGNPRDLAPVLLAPP
jgi:regulator of protease activity HflC (stomatin/prohibitin superfamily)